MMSTETKEKIFSPVPGVVGSSPTIVGIVTSDRNVTVVGKRFCRSDALFYCWHHYLHLLSLHYQEELSRVEQLLLCRYSNLHTLTDIDI